MRLDHLLSKEEKSRGWIAVLLLRVLCEDMKTKSIRAQDENNEKMHKEFLVAMRLGETPVLIPNTMVKT